MRESNAAEYIGPVWIPDEAVPLISTAATGLLVGGMTTEADVDGIVDLTGVATHFRVDIDTINPFVADPNESQATWIINASGGFHIRLATTNWTYE